MVVRESGKYEAIVQTEGRNKDNKGGKESREAKR